MATFGENPTSLHLWKMRVITDQEAKVKVKLVMKINLVSLLLVFRASRFGFREGY